MAKASMRSFACSAPAVVTPSKTVNFRPTSEQDKVLALFKTGEDLVIEAGAGTGKTSTLAMLAKSTSRPGRYLAFNKALVEDSRSKFPSNIACSTAHSLAYQSVGKRYSHRLNGDRMKPSTLAELLGITVAKSYQKANSNYQTALTVSQMGSIVRQAVDRFCQSGDVEISKTHFPWQRGLSRDANNQLRKDLVRYARRFWEDIEQVSGTLPFSHGCYLKLYELNKPYVEADFILLDEAQDLAPVLISIAEKQKHAQLVVVGDANQQIYDFTGAVNALSKFSIERRAMLSQSFRFGKAIADVANLVLAQLDSELRLKGWGDESSVGMVENPTAILTRTNAAALEALLESGKKVHIVGGGEDLIRFCWAAADLQKGSKVTHPDLICFANWNEVQDYVKDGGNDLKLIVSLINRFGAARIAQAVRNQPPEKDAEIVYSTAHKSKGREWPMVQLASDFMQTSKCECDHGEKVHNGQAGECATCDCPTFTPKVDSASEKRLLYVAITRARLRLDPGALRITEDGVTLASREEE